MDPLAQAALDVRENAYAPYSKYKVGAALQDERGRVHLGVNVENVSFGATICAERSAVLRMVAEGGRRVQRLAVATRDGGAPCGICLQVLSEFCDHDMPVLLVSESGATSETHFRELAPQPFKSEHV